MLVLSRKPNEAIVIGREGETKITILAVKGYQVKIGIEAPKEICVHREEVYERIQDMFIKNLVIDRDLQLESAANQDGLF